VTLTGQAITAEEYLARPPEDRSTQLVGGEIVVNQPSVRHQDLSGLIYRRLADWVDSGTGNGLACISVDVMLDEANVFAPDVWWVTEEHRPHRDASGLEGPPDLAVEVRSPSTWRYDIGAKKASYQHHGLAELWLVDTESATVLVYRRSVPAAGAFDIALELGAGETLTSPLLPGFTLAVAEIFDR
jgi:Uma2 family endonuclease